MNDRASAKTVGRSFAVAAIVLAAVPSALLGLSLLGFFPWSEINCWGNDIDIASGRIRYTRDLLFIRVEKSVFDSALSRALLPEDHADKPPDWQPVVTFSPRLRHSPNYRFHSATYQIHLLEQLWQSGRMTPKARRQTARHVLDLWMKTGSDFRVGEYLVAVAERVTTASERGMPVDVDDLPAR